MSSVSGTRALWSRILLGVTGLGAAVGVVYLFYKRKEKESSKGDETAQHTRGSSIKKKRNSSGGNRVTFSDQDEIIGMAACSSPPPVVSKEDLERERTNVQEDGIGVIGLCKNGDSLASASVLESISTPTANKDDTDVLQKKEQNKNNVAQDVSVAAGFASNGHDLQAITPETDYDRSSTMREKIIQRDHVPGLIGKKGVNIKAIQQNSNTIITFKDETLDNGDRVCQIRGLPQDVTVAESLIEKFIFEQPFITSQIMHVPQSSVGRIIGKGGETIRGIQDMTRAKVIVDTANQFHNRDTSDMVRMVTVTIRGTEDQIEAAKQMVIEKVEEERALRRNIEIVTSSRTPRRAGTNPTVSNSTNPEALNGSLPAIPRSGVFEVFVSCAFHPNDFFVQVRGRDSIELDKLTETMTEWYSKTPAEESPSLSIGEIVAAPFEVDGKMYRAKIIGLSGNMADVSYVDYGDRRTIKLENIRRIQPDFLRLRFQAIQATLNLACIEERWTDNVIDEFCDLTYCAQWQPLTAQVKHYINKAQSDSKETVLLVELYDRDLNIGVELVNRGYATLNHTLPSLSETPSSSSSSNINSKKSYASVVAEDEIKSQDQVPIDTLNGNE